MIFSTGGEWSAHWAGWFLKKLTRLPWIAELHDPLVDRYDYDDDGVKPRRTKDARMRQRLEKMICRDATCVWWFTEGAFYRALKRNPCLGTRGFWVLPGAHPPIKRDKYIKRKQLRISHFGSLANSRSLSDFLSALEIFVGRNPDCAGQLLIDIYGSNLDPATLRFLKEHKLQKFVRANGRLEFDPVTGLTGREQVLVQMQTSDILLLIHGNAPFCEEYIPSKFYDYLWSFRPILAIPNRNPQLEQLVQRFGGWCARQGETQELVARLEEIWALWLKDGLASLNYEPIDVSGAVDKILMHFESNFSR
jgi:hypothetical protein